MITGQKYCVSARNRLTGFTEDITGPKKRKPGGGRKKGEPTKVIRVPASRVEDIKKLIGKS